MLTSYYLLLAVHFDLRWLGARRDEARGPSGPFLAFWAASVLAFMTHQVGAVYASALLAHAAFVSLHDPSKRPTPRSVATAGLFAALAVAPWYAWLAATFGPSHVVASTPTSGMLADQPHPAPLRLLAAYASNFATTFVPDRLIRSVVFEPFSAGAVVIHVTALYFCQVPGALTLSLTAYLCWRALRGGWPSEFRVPDGGVVLAFAVLGALAAAALHPSRARYGLGHNVVFPSTLVLVIWGWGVLSRGADRWARVACFAVAIESLAVLWAHLAWVYLYLTTGRIASDLNWVVQREEHLVFLHDLFPRSVPVLLAAALGVQAALIRLLVGWSRSAAVPAR
jgi:hypothetical protein